MSQKAAARLSNYLPFGGGDDFGVFCFFSRAFHSAFNPMKKILILLLLALSLSWSQLATAQGNLVVKGGV